MLPPPVGIAEIIEPAPAPSSNAAPVATKFTPAVAPTRIPVSTPVKVAAPISTPEKPEKIHRPAVTALVPQIACDIAPLVISPDPVGANVPGSVTLA